MKILKNQLYIEYIPDRQEIIVSRLIEGSSDKNLLTIYSLSKLKSMNIHDAGRLIGEDILNALEGTRKEFIPLTG
jgi:hypothetical protein